MTYALAFLAGYLLRQYSPSIVSRLAVLAVKLKRNLRHGPAAWTI